MFYLSEKIYVGSAIVSRHILSPRWGWHLHREKIWPSLKRRKDAMWMYAWSNESWEEESWLHREEQIVAKDPRDLVIAVLARGTKSWSRWIERSGQCEVAEVSRLMRIRRCALRLPQGCGHFAHNTSAEKLLLTMAVTGRTGLVMVGQCRPTLQ